VHIGEPIQRVKMTQLEIGQCDRLYRHVTHRCGPVRLKITTRGGNDKQGRIPRVQEPKPIRELFVEGYHIRSHLGNLVQLAGVGIVPIDKETDTMPESIQSVTRLHQLGQCTSDFTDIACLNVIATDHNVQVVKASGDERIEAGWVHAYKSTVSTIPTSSLISEPHDDSRLTRGGRASVMTQVPSSRPPSGAAACWAADRIVR